MQEDNIIDELTLKYVIASDTDSSYIDLSAVFYHSPTLDEVVFFADNIGNEINSLFPRFLAETFNVPENRRSIIQTKRELVSDKSIFVAKKNYIMSVRDKEGIQKKSMKYVGVEIKKSNTPKIIQKFLRILVKMIINKKEYARVLKFIDSFKKSYFTQPMLIIGNPTTLKNITKYEEKLELQGDFKGFSQHAKAALIYNSMCSASDKRIYSGSKIKLIYVNHPQFACIAIPSDGTIEPEFLKDIPINYEEMWATVDSKIERYLKPAGMNRESRQRAKINKFIKF